jgi:hypothetical protein
VAAPRLKGGSKCDTGYRPLFKWQEGFFSSPWRCTLRISHLPAGFLSLLPPEPFVDSDHDLNVPSEIVSGDSELLIGQVGQSLRRSTAANQATLGRFGACAISLCWLWMNRTRYLK